MNCLQEMKEIYDSLQDDLSKEVFWAKVRYDMDPIFSNVIELMDLSEKFSDEEIAALKGWKYTFQEIKKEKKEVLLYGAGNVGKLVASFIIQEKEDFLGFCDKNYDKISSQEVFEKPVFPPEYLFEHADSVYVWITTTLWYDQVLDYLLSNGFQESHIIKCRLDKVTDYKKPHERYFEFPNLYKSGTAFVDAGCEDGMDSIRFASLVKGEYSTIFAFEPDGINLQRCVDNLTVGGVKNFEIIAAGLSDFKGQVSFAHEPGGASYVVDTQSAHEMVELIRNNTQHVTIPTITLDETVTETPVGFIKMDIEGSELSALQGARQTILRDKPLLAISVYHKTWDVLTIGKFLKDLVPEYRFWLRHYGPLGCDTVLYAAL